MVEDDYEESSWLRDEIDDEDILALFTERPAALRIAVRHLIERVADEEEMESRLIDALDLALEEGGDASEVPAWMAIVLGEARSTAAIPLLLRSVVTDEDEMLQDAAGVALLRIGAPALRRIMDDLEENSGGAFRRAAYRLLGQAGVVGDPDLEDDVRDFLASRLPFESEAETADGALDELVEASARIGLRRLIEPFERLLRTRFRGNHAALEDALAMLAQNPTGSAFVPTVLPWEEKYGWVIEETERDPRVRRPGKSAPAVDEAGEPPPGGGEKDAPRRGIFLDIPGLDDVRRENEHEERSEENGA